MSGSGKGLLGLWLYRMGDEEWKLKDSYNSDRQVFIFLFGSLFFSPFCIFRYDQRCVDIDVDGSEIRHEDEYDDFLAEESTRRLGQSS